MKNVRKFALSTTLFAATLAVAVSCGKDKEKTETTPAAGGGKLATQFSPNQIATTALTDAMALLNEKAGSQTFNLNDPSLILGQSSPESFTSAKFRVSDLTLCGKSSTTGDSCLERPWELYSDGKQSEQNEYNNFVPSVAHAFTDWTDFLDKTSVAKIANSATYTDIHVGLYDSVVVHFYRAFAIKASIPLNTGVTLYTKNSSTFVDNGKTGLDVTYENSADGKLTTAPAEDAVMFLPNGGKTFLLSKSFEITADDVKSQVPFKMILAYDPNGIIKGTGTATGPTGNSWLDGQVDHTLGYKIQAPFLEFSPVLARETETIMKETYLLSSDGDSAIGASQPGPKTPFSVRLTMYYVKEDETKSVRGVTTANLLNEKSTSLPPDVLSGIKKVVINADGTLNFINASTESPALKNFTRLKKGVVGTVTGTTCLYGQSSAGCSASKDGATPIQSNLTYTYTLIGEGQVDETFTAAYVTPKPTPTAEPTATP